MEKPLKRLADLNTKDCLWIYLLRILKDGPRHGYILREEVNKRFGFMPGTVTSYRVLYSLKADGFVQKKPDGRKEIYTITPKGLEILKKAVNFYENLGKLLKS
ncbi:MAG: helix-turn-helix transcriptional regulator [Candidatus Aenigmarchaeota archaeon]|nr:helix-turn-helix transcriptional regulator [Candidatus Aenigmarchaeota archaeon]